MEEKKKKERENLVAHSLLFTRANAILRAANRFELRRSTVPFTHSLTHSIKTKDSLNGRQHSERQVHSGNLSLSL